MEITVKQTTAYKAARFFSYLFLMSGAMLIFNNSGWAEYAPQEAHFSFHLAALGYALLIVFFYFMYHCKASKDALDNDKKVSVPIFILFCACVSAIYILAMVLKTSDLLYPILITVSAIGGAFEYIARQAK